MSGAIARLKPASIPSRAIGVTSNSDSRQSICCRFRCMAYESQTQGLIVAVTDPLLICVGLMRMRVWV